jgi:hypothetical protein
MNPEEIPLLVIFAVLAYIGLSIMEGPSHRRLCDYVARVAMKQWLEWMREYERTGRWEMKFPKSK